MRLIGIREAYLIGFFGLFKRRKQKAIQRNPKLINQLLVEKLTIYESPDQPINNESKRVCSLAF
jgi:hypothetical protein